MKVFKNKVCLSFQNFWVNRLENKKKVLNCKLTNFNFESQLLDMIELITWKKAKNISFKFETFCFILGEPSVVPNIFYFCF